MKLNDTLKIAIADPSIIIRTGVVGVLKRTLKSRIQLTEISTQTGIFQSLSVNKPDVLMINPFYWGVMDFAKIKEEYSLPNLKLVALVYTQVDDNILKQYDESIFMFDSIDQISTKIEHMFNVIGNNSNDNSIGSDILSQREKEIIACVVKGMTNKEIADMLFLSTHTVITHRRNIARKLEVHSTAGLTVYAIVNKLISLDEINKKMD